MARDMGLSVSSASQHLRALNARGFLVVRRKGRYVFYRVGCDKSVPDAAAILMAVADALLASKNAIETVFRTVTACTHPRRLDILRSLGGSNLTFSEMRKVMDVSRSALQRHLSKLETRGFVTARDGVYRCCKPRDPLARTLMLLASR
jgi:DNA-binding transcriptional ArsR family regulator